MNSETNFQIQTCDPNENIDIFEVRFTDEMMEFIKNYPNGISIQKNTEDVNFLFHIRILNSSSMEFHLK